MNVRQWKDRLDAVGSVVVDAAEIAAVAEVLDEENKSYIKEELAFCELFLVLVIIFIA